ncbi:hypothetical protein BB559_007076 [Furculomyces boomerangus]|uniref:Uncharacterized protein n=2 Tax=Harpellales TaxID=61421 RepID=A0A2T9XZ35_9FUNG|nr:hypothetical protein BB559_007076 [Furculomyces boomerangus]
MLGHAGLDLKFMLDQEFFPDLTQCIVKYENRIVKLLNKAIAEDNFDVIKNVPLEKGSAMEKLFGENVPLISSVAKLDRHLSEFCVELKYIVMETLYGQVVTSVSAIIESILKQFLLILRKGEIPPSKGLIVLANTQAVISWAIPRCAANLDRVFGRTVSDIHNLESRLEGFPGTLQEVLCQRWAQLLVFSTFDFGGEVYLSTGQVDESMGPSKGVVELVREFGRLDREIRSYKLERQAILGGTIDHMFYIMLDDKFWVVNGRSVNFSHKGVHQLVLDTHFFLKVCGPLVSKVANKAANKVCEKALRIFFASHPSNDLPMMGRQWYDSKVKDTLNQLGPNFKLSSTAAK